MDSVDLSALRARLHAALGPDLLAPDYRADWSPDNPTAGLCSVACEAAWFVLGGLPSAWVPRVARDGEAGTHWWLEHRETGARFDPTDEQYRTRGAVPPYERGLEGKGAGFMGLRRDPGSPWGFERRPSARAQALLDRMLGGQSPDGFRAALAQPPRRPRLR